MSAGRPRGRERRREAVPRPGDALGGRVAVATQSFRRRCFLPGCSSPGSHGGVENWTAISRSDRSFHRDPNFSRRRASPPVRAHVVGPETNRAMRQARLGRRGNQTPRHRHCFSSLGSMGGGARPAYSGRRTRQSPYIFRRFTLHTPRRPVKIICWGGREAGPYWFAGIVTTGADPLTPVSAIENSSMITPNVYLDWISVSAIQNHLPSY
jgi:hypothetical protein